MAKVRRPTLPVSKPLAANYRLIQRQWRQRGVQGFTLLEALVTLVLLGLLVGVVFPNMSRWYDGLQRRQALAQVRGQLQQLSAAAVFVGQDLALSDVMGAQATMPTRYRVVLPSGWALVAAGDLRFLRTGFCHPGSATLMVGTQAVQVKLTSVMCDLEMVPVVIVGLGA